MNYNKKKTYCTYRIHNKQYKTLNKYYRSSIIKYKISSELQANNFKCITEKLAFYATLFA